MRWVLVGYTTLTIVLYFVMAPLTVIGLVDKMIEVALIVLLLADAYMADSEPSRTHMTGS